MDEGSITVQALRKMPEGHPLYFVQTRDMDDKPIRAVVWIWTDKREGVRKAYFNPVNGDYLGEAA